MKQLWSFIEHKYQLIYMMLVVVSILLYLLLAIDCSVWADEAYTMVMIKHSFSEIVKITAADVHPPLYYILLKIFLIPFGDSLFMAEVFSIVPFVLILAVGGIQLKKLFNTKIAVLFMALFFLYPYTMTYASEIRMYSLAAFFVFMTALYAFRSWCCGRWLDWGLCAVFGVCSAYTHYYAMASVGIIYGLLFLAIVIGKKQRIGKWFSMMIFTIVLYLPWLKYFTQQLSYKVNHEYWIPPITVKTLMSYVCDIFSSKGVSAFVLYAGSCYAVAFIYILLKKNRKDILIALSALAVPCGTILIGIVASVVVRPVFVSRYCIPSVPLLVFFMSFVMGKMSGDILPSVFITVFLIGGIGNYEKCIISAWQSEPSGLDTLLSNGYDIPECIVVWDSDSSTFVVGHISQVLSYYYPEISVYRKGPYNSEAMPYTNIYMIQDFSTEVNGRLLLLMAPGQPIPKEFQINYSCRYIGKADQYECIADVYLLTNLGS